MLVMRPVHGDDLDGLLGLAAQAGFGLTTLPRDPKLIKRRIDESQRAFEKVDDDARPRGESYLFVLEDVTTGEIAGTSGVVSKAGGFEPFYAYRLETTVHESTLLKVRKEVRLLHLLVEHDGPCEIGSLFLAPQHRGGGNGRLVSLARFLFMAEFPGYFDPTVIAEMRGVIDHAGRSPLWDALGRHFFEIELPQADYLSVVDKRFIADLMPRHPIYVNLLPPEAQAVIGQVHEQTAPALKILEAEGFHSAGMVDIFEGGPIVTCARDEVGCVSRSSRTTVAGIVDEQPGEEMMIVARPSRAFRACQATVKPTDDGGVAIDRATALALGLHVGDAVRYAPLRPPKRKDD